MPPTLHMIGLPHTKISNDYSHCAFTGKILRFPKMMNPFGYNVVEYSTYGSESEAQTKHNLFSPFEFEDLTKLHAQEFPGEVARMDSTLYQEYNIRLLEVMTTTVKAGDIVCHPFGPPHQILAQAFPQAFHVETGIGYNNPWAGLRIYESHAWWHYHQGKEGRYGHNYEFVIPNYYDVDEWDVQCKPGEYLVCFGRVQDDKGLYVVKEIAKHTGIKTIICGKGDPTPYLDPSVPNLIYEPPITGLERSRLLGNAMAILMPTIFTEPFGGSGVEAQLCGTPLIASAHGAFSETVEYPELRCRTLRQWLEAVELTKTINRQRIAERARAKYCLQNVGEMYDKAFKQIAELSGEGWYSV
jgi:glycosyltransferase involved in cell wall biosynthesis